MIIAASGLVRLSSQKPVEQSTALTLFCDFDGPIVDVSDRYYLTYQMGLAEVKSVYQRQGATLPLHCLSKQQFWQMKQERTPDPEIALRSGLRREQIDQFLDCVKQIVNQPQLLHQDRLQPGVQMSLTLLHRQGVQLVLVTLRQQQQVTRMLQDYGLESLFSQVWGANDDHAAYLNQAEHKTRLLKQAVAHCSPQADAWMIGDTEADVLAGQATGLPTIALTCGIRSRAYLQKFQPTQIHNDLRSAAYSLARSLPSVA
jgi:phosphoglycolate phosphatase